MHEPRTDGGAGGPDDAARLERAGEIFFAVRGLGLAARDEAIEAACGGDAKLRALVMLLIRGADAPMPIEGLADDIRAAADGDARGDGDGDRIGNYRLLSRIGEGGFGVVYEAEQERPVRRRVALKIIKLGMDTRQVVARFEAERQALALMDHPNIAKVFDAGATPTGRPYFVMELVKGSPATAYCDEHRLGIRERLDIVATVCEALQHAHQKGVIHRDIKPSNVLVATIDGKVVAKIIDFGIAKATSARLTEKTIFTEFRQLIGTPEYMSPEQAGQSAEDVDTRTDVYAIGVLLYELLTGSTPFDSERLRSAAYGELLRIIREEEPLRPSTRIGTLGGTVGQVAALRQAIADRYMDLAMFAEALPLQESALATRRKVLGDDHIDTLSSINNMGVLLQWWGKLSEAEPYLRECLERKRRVLGDDHRETIAAIANMGSQMIYLGKPMEAEPYYKEALERSRRLQDEPNDPMINMLGSMATLLNEQGKYVEAEKLNREALELNRRAYGNDHKATLVSIGNIGTVLKAQGRLAEAEPFMREAVEGRRRVLGGEHPDTMVAISELEILLQAQGKLDEAEPLAREVLEKQLKLFGYESLDTLISVNSLGGLLLAKQKNREALETLAPAEGAARAVLGNSARKHRFLLNLGTAQGRTGDFAAGEATLIEAQSAAAKLRGESHRDTRHCNQALIDLYAAWDAAQPGKGYDARAAEWRTTLEAAVRAAEASKK